MEGAEEEEKEGAAWCVVQGLIPERRIPQIDTFIFQRPRLGEEISTSNFLTVRSFSRSAVQTRPAGRGLARCQASTD